MRLSRAVSVHEVASLSLPRVVNDKLDTILHMLVEEARKEPHKRQKFASLKWKALERVKSASPIRDAIQATLECTISQSDAEIIFCHYRASHGIFDYASFLLDFATRYEQPALRPRAQTMPLLPSTHTQSHDHIIELWQKARSEAAAVSATKGFLASIEDKSRQRALLALDVALRKRIANRFHENLSLIESMGHIPRKDFRTAMRNGLNLHLTEIEARCLFDVFDTNEDGIVTSAELISAIHRMLHESRKRLNDEAYTMKHIHKHVRCERLLTRNTFDKTEFKRAMVILTDTVTDYSRLELPDNLLSQAYIRTCIQEQLNVKLSSLQMQCLCHKLSKIRPQPILDRNHLTRTYSSVCSGEDTARSETEYMSDGPINGKILESFYFQLCKFILKAP